MIPVARHVWQQIRSERPAALALLFTISRALFCLNACDVSVTDFLGAERNHQVDDGGRELSYTATTADGRRLTANYGIKSCCLRS